MAAKKAATKKTANNSVATEKPVYKYEPPPPVPKGLISYEEFTLMAIEKLRDPGYKGIHVVIKGYNEALKEYYGNHVIPRNVVKFLEDSGKIQVRPAKKGVMIYPPDVKLPPRSASGTEVLAKMGIGCGKNPPKSDGTYGWHMEHEVRVIAPPKLPNPNMENIMPALSGKDALAQMFGTQDKVPAKVVAKSTRNTTKAKKIPNLLAHSPSFKAETSWETQQCLAIVESFADSTYRAPTGWITKAKQACEDAAIKGINEQKLTDSLYMLRTTYLLLQGDKAAQAAFNERKGRSHRFTAIRYLIRDGLATKNGKAKSVISKEEAVASKPGKKKLHLNIDGRPVRTTPAGLATIAALRVLNRSPYLTMDANQLYKLAKIEVNALLHRRYQLVHKFFFTLLRGDMQEKYLSLTFTPEGRVSTVRFDKYNGKPFV